MCCMSWQIQSAFHEKKHVADMAFARIPLVWQGRRTQWCIKPLCSYGTFNTGLKHQRFRTAFSVLSREHIWNLPAIYTLVIYKNIFYLHS